MTKNINMPAVAVHPGEILQHEFLSPLSLSQTALATHIGVSPRRINEICRGKRAITAETALLLSKALGTTAQFWMNGQALYDLALANKTCSISKIKKIATVR